MDETVFRRNLKSYGKKEHVISGLVEEVRRYERWLEQTCGKSAGEASSEEMLAFLRSVEGAAKEYARAIGLHYRFVGKQELAVEASNFREGEIAKTRKIFELKDFRGVDQGQIQALKAAGIVNVEQMIAAGRTPELRQKLAEATGVPVETVLELVKLSDLSRLGAIKEVRARLYYDAGVDTPEKFAAWDPDELVAMLKEWVERTEFEGIAPLPKEVRNGVAKARSAPKLVEY